MHEIFEQMKFLALDELDNQMFFFRAGLFTALLVHPLSTWVHVRLGLQSFVVKLICAGPEQTSVVLLWSLIEERAFLSFNVTIAPFIACYFIKWNRSRHFLDSTCCFLLGDFRLHRWLLLVLSWGLDKRDGFMVDFRLHETASHLLVVRWVIRLKLVIVHDTCIVNKRQKDEVCFDLFGRKPVPSWGDWASLLRVRSISTWHHCEFLKLLD